MTASCPPLPAAPQPALPERPESDAPRFRPLAASLTGCLERLPQGVRALSLDLDLLLWPTLAAEDDVACVAAATPAWRAAGLTVARRADAGRRARARARLSASASGPGPAAASLEAIHALALGPLAAGAGGAVLAEATVAAEIDADAAHRRPFAPAVALLRAAAARGLRTHVTSGGPIGTARLRHLVETAFTAAGEPMPPIDGLHADRRRAGDRFGALLDAEGLDADALVHVAGDPVAGVAAAEDAGIRAIGVVRGPTGFSRLEEAEARAALLLDPDARRSLPVTAPWRQARALDDSPPSAAWRLGFDALGPAMLAFANGLALRVAALHADGLRPRLLFASRDAALLARVYAAWSPTVAGGVAPYATMPMGGFVAWAATLDSADAIDELLAARLLGPGIVPDAPGGDPGSLDALSRQLMLPRTLSRLALKIARESADPVASLCLLARSPEGVARITARSRRYAARFALHLARHPALQDLGPEDVVLLVDVGGGDGATARLASKVAQACATRVDTWALLARGQADPGRATFDAGNTEPRALDLIADAAAPLARLCRDDGRDTIDFTMDGRAVATDAALAASPTRAAVQAGALVFVLAGIDGDCPVPGSPLTLAAARASLARWLLWPEADELAVLDAVAHETGMQRPPATAAAARAVRRFGPAAPLRALEAATGGRGPFDTARLAAEGADAALAAIAARRFGLPTACGPDAGPAGREVDLMLGRDRSVVASRLVARPTVDGWYALQVPTGRRETSVGVLLGRVARFVQLDSVLLVPTHTVGNGDPSLEAIDVTDRITLERISRQDDGLLVCNGRGAFFYLQADAAPTGREWTVWVTFRPLDDPAGRRPDPVRRETAAR